MRPKKEDIMPYTPNKDLAAEHFILIRLEYGVSNIGIFDLIERNREKSESERGIAERI